jgi:hypothetical protein
MKGSDIPKRRDVILSVATLALALLAAGIIVATASTDEFVAWAWRRHHNVLSWYVRPLFFLPFCYFAYRRSLWGIALTLLALVTSMFWFPAPEHTSPAVNEMLASEREYLTANWTLWKILIALLAPAHFRGVGAGFLEAIARLGVGGGQRGGSVQDRVDLPLQHRGGCHVASACCSTGTRGLQRPDPLRHA